MFSIYKFFFGMVVSISILPTFLLSADKYLSEDDSLEYLSRAQSLVCDGRLINRYSHPRINNMGGVLLLMTNHLDGVTSLIKCIPYTDSNEVDNKYFYSAYKDGFKCYGGKKPKKEEDGIMCGAICSMYGSREYIGACESAMSLKKKNGKILSSDEFVKVFDPIKMKAPYMSEEEAQSRFLAGEKLVCEEKLISQVSHPEHTRLVGRISVYTKYIDSYTWLDDCTIYTPEMKLDNKSFYDAYRKGFFCRKKKKSADKCHDVCLGYGEKEYIGACEYSLLSKEKQLSEKDFIKVFDLKEAMQLVK